MIRVCVIDDHAAVRIGIRSLLEADREIEVAADTGDCESIIDMCTTVCPDIVLLDLGLSGGVSGLDYVAAIVDQCPGARVIMLTGSHRASQVEETLRRGAKGYLTHASLNEAGLLEAVKAVHGGRIFLDELASAALSASWQSGDMIRRASLTSRERQVLKLLGEGLSNKDIAEGLGISVKTVRNYLSNSYVKLGLESRVEAALLARDLQ